METGKKRLTVAVIKGDGIGPEVIDEGLKVIRSALGRCACPAVDFVELPGGAAHWQAYGEALPAESRELCLKADAVYFGASGLPEVKYPDGTGVSVAWELRRLLDLYAAVRPITLLNPALSPLARPGEIRFTIVRENSEGIYATRQGGTILHDEVAVNTIMVTRKGTERIMRFAFDLAGSGPGAPADGRRRVTCVDKSNVLASWAFFRKIYDETALDYPHIERDYSYIDAVTLQLLRQPQHFDVIVTENQHGDILSELGAALVGGLGFAPSANVGQEKAMFEPSHGTAPTIAGRNMANPVAAILAGELMLRWLARRLSDEGLASAAEAINRAVRIVVGEGTILTPDAGGRATTMEMGDAVASVVEGLSA